MTSLLKENMVTTKDASNLSGYTSDHLGRLIRSGKIEGEKIGRNWIVNKSSLELFLKEQKSLKTDRARDLSAMRAEEYRRYHRLVRRATDDLTKEIPISPICLRTGTVQSHLLALSVALAVIVSGANLARADVLQKIVGQVTSVAQDVAIGFNESFGAIPAHFAMKLAAITNAELAVSSHVGMTSTAASIHFTSPLLADPDLSFLRMVFDDSNQMHPTSWLVASHAQSAERASQLITADAVQTFASDAYAFVTSPSQVTNALLSAYSAFGTQSYAGITTLFAGYRLLIEHSGAAALSLAIDTRDRIVEMPRLVWSSTLALGNTVIDVSHAVIHADVATAYGLAIAAPVSARVSVEFIGGIGDTLTTATAQVPHLTAELFLRGTALPVTLAPALARAVLGVEYEGVARFVALTHIVTGKYLVLIETTGRFAYVSAERARSLTIAFAHATATIEDAYLGVLGESALALNSVEPSSALAAVAMVTQPALSAGEQTTFMVYQMMHSIFSTTIDTFDRLFTDVQRSMVHLEHQNN